MLTFASLLAAMTIAGAFLVGVLAARRLRDWGEGRRALEECSPPLALAAASSLPPDDPRTRRVRELVATRLRAISAAEAHGAMSAPADDAPRQGDLSLATLRVQDVVMIDAGDTFCDGDYLVEGLCRLREGATSTSIVVMADGDRRRWLVGGPQEASWLVVEEIEGHGLRGEPPRNIRRPEGDYFLARRGQASAAAFGQHGRPDRSRVATYIYNGPAGSSLWLERWGDDVLLGQGRSVAPHNVSYLPAS